MLAMHRYRPQCTIRDVLVAVALIGSGVALAIDFNVHGYPRIGFCCGAVLMGAAYGVLMHRVWYGVAIGCVAFAFMPVPFFKEPWHTIVLFAALVFSQRTYVQFRSIRDRAVPPPT
jgi:hypothetical protein